MLCSRFSSLTCEPNGASSEAPQVSKNLSTFVPGHVMFLLCHVGGHLERLRRNTFTLRVMGNYPQAECIFQREKLFSTAVKNIDFSLKVKKLSEYFDSIINIYKPCQISIYRFSCLKNTFCPNIMIATIINFVC